MTRFMTNRSTRVGVVVAVQLVIAVAMVIGADWAPENARRIFHSYFADLALPFGYYFLLTLVEDEVRFLQPWYGKALTVLSLVSASEVLQYFGIYALASVFDPFDFVACVSGVLLAVVFDVGVIAKLLRPSEG
jgi:hypothetical protein